MLTRPRSYPTFPADFWTSFPGNSANISVWTPIGNAQTVNVKPGLPSILEWDWAPPVATAQHSCVLVVCDSTADSIPAANKVFNIATLVTSERHVGLKNLHVVDPPPADGGDTLIVQYQFRTEGGGEIIRLYSGLRDWSVGLVLPAKIAESVRSSAKPTQVPAKILKEILKVSERDAPLLKDSRLLQFKSLAQPVELTGFPVSKKPFPGYLLLTRNQKKAAGGALNIVQFAGQRVLGGNTFVIRMPRIVAGRERRT
jgi:hypothetical protein